MAYILSTHDLTWNSRFLTMRHGRVVPCDLYIANVGRLVASGPSHEYVRIAGNYHLKTLLLLLPCTISTRYVSK